MATLIQAEISDVAHGIMQRGNARRGHNSATTPIRQSQKLRKTSRLSSMFEVQSLRFISQIGRLTLIALLLFQGSSIRGNSRKPKARDRIAIAEDFLQTFYPQLSGKGYFMSVEGLKHFDDPGPLPGFTIYIGARPKDQILYYVGGYVGTKPPPGYHEGPVYAEQLLSGDFKFRPDNRLWLFTAAGAGVGNRVVDHQMSELVAAHPDISEAEIVEALRKAGVKYGPLDKEKFVRDLPIAKLERFLGKLTVLSVQFEPLKDDRENLNHWPDWDVHFRAVSATGQQFTYEIFFDRFRGDVLRIFEPPLWHGE